MTVRYAASALGRNMHACCVEGMLLRGLHSPSRGDLSVGLHRGAYAAVVVVLLPVSFLTTMAHTGATQQLVSVTSVDHEFQVVTNILDRMLFRLLNGTLTYPG